MDTVQILKDARALIADEKNWTRNAFARDSKGNEVTPDKEDATCFCAIGALSRVVQQPPYYDLPGERLLGDEAWISGEIGVAEFNDAHTHEDVLALFDRAIARAESGAA